MLLENQKNTQKKGKPISLEYICDFNNKEEMNNSKIVCKGYFVTATKYYLTLS